MHRLNKRIVATLFTGFAFSAGILAQNLGVNTPSPVTKLDINGDISWREGAGLTLNNGTNANIPVGDYSFFRITGPTAAFSISGIAGGSDGRIVTIYNTTTQAMTIVNDAGSGTNNRIFTLTGANITTPAANSAIQLQYNANVNRWLLVSGQNISTPVSAGTGWLLTGNAGTVDGTDFLGTTDNVPVNFKTDNQKAGRIDTDGNIHLGFKAGNVSTGTGNILIGSESGNITTNGSNNTGFGYRTFYYNVSGIGNVGIGKDAFYANVDGDSNTAIGVAALYINEHVNGNTAVGYTSLQVNAGTGNTAMGLQALNSNGTGWGNTGFGGGAMNTNTIGKWNTAVGYQAMESTTNGNSNTVFGYGVMYDNNNGSSNVVAGYNAMRLTTTASSNVAFGALALYNNTTAGNLIAIGDSALFNNGMGSSGANALGNTAIGAKALFSNSSGAGNTVFGFRAGSTMPSLANTSGSNNTYVGRSTGSGATTQLSNAGAIGANAAVSVSNAIVLGGVGAQAVNVGVGTSSPTSPLHVVGIPVFSNNAAAVTGGLTSGAFYRTGADPDVLHIVQ